MAEMPDRLVTISMSDESIETMNRLSAALEAQQPDYYDEDTLMKAAEAIRATLYAQTGLDQPKTVTEIIGAMQNAGILFRERK
jgi:hypothetical protein